MHPRLVEDHVEVREVGLRHVFERLLVLLLQLLQLKVLGPVSYTHLMLPTKA